MSISPTNRHKGEINIHSSLFALDCHSHVLHSTDFDFGFLTRLTSPARTYGTRAQGGTQEHFIGTRQLYFLLGSLPLKKNRQKKKMGNL